MRAPKTSDVESQLRAIERLGGEGDIDFGSGEQLHVSNLSKVYFPESGATKGALMRYYTRIWPLIKQSIEDRPLVLKRYPDGVGGPMFYQQNASASVPNGVRVETLHTAAEGPKPRIIGGELLTLLYTVQLGAIEVHPWLSRVADIEAADRCLIDLDPGDDVPFSTVVGLARDVIAIAKQCGLVMAVKTSGAAGIHLVIPLPGTSYEESARLALLIARAAVALRPEAATVERAIRARPKGTIYVDALQNSRGKSMASAYSVRATPEATVSAPLRERELTSRLRTAGFTIRTMPARATRVGDLWEIALSHRVTARTVRDAVTALEHVLDDATPPNEPTPNAKRARGGARTTAKRRQTEIS